jgi:hypothetical protein
MVSVTTMAADSWFVEAYVSANMAMLSLTTMIDAIVKTDRLFRVLTGRRALAVGGANDGDATAPRSRRELTSGTPFDHGLTKRIRERGVHAFHLLDSNQSRGRGSEWWEFASTGGTLD